MQRIFCAAFGFCVCLYCSCFADWRMFGYDIPWSVCLLVSCACCLLSFFYRWFFFFSMQPASFFPNWVTDLSSVFSKLTSCWQRFVIETLCFLTFLYFFGRALSIECVVVSMICLIPAWLSTLNYDTFVFYWFANKYMYCFSLKSLLLLNAILIFGEIILSLIFW